VSLNTFSSVLTPDPASRRFVVATGIVALLGGAVVIVGLPFDWSWRLLFAVAWAVLVGKDLLAILRGFRHCSRIRFIHTGELQISAAGSCCAAATLESGSLVLRRFAWLRFRTEDGRRHVELLRRKMAQNKDWRRLQVIWRHLGAGR